MGTIPELQIRSRAALLNRVERFFLDITDKRIRYGVFISVAELEDGLPRRAIARSALLRDERFARLPDRLLGTRRACLIRLPNHASISRGPSTRGAASGFWPRRPSSSTHNTQDLSHCEGPSNEASSPCHATWQEIPCFFVKAWPGALKTRHCVRSCRTCRLPSPGAPVRSRRWGPGREGERRHGPGASAPARRR